MTISIDESIRLFKTEIIAQDQRLPPRRSEPLLAACACLKQRFSSRKNILAILGMTEGVILYMGKRQAAADPDCLDFLKEALAHVVNIYEEGKFVPEREEELGRRMHKRFTALKVHLKEQRQTQKAGPPVAAPRPPQPPQPQAPRPQPPRPQATPGQTPSPQTVIAGGRTREYAPRVGEHFHLVAIGDFPLLIGTAAIALISPLKPRDRKTRLTATEIPLKDFRRLFTSLPRCFAGPLAQIPAGRLKKLKLPLILPQGGGLPLLPAEDADHLLVISHGQWHGVLPVHLETGAVLTLQRFQAAANGDIAGLATMDDDSSYPLLNPRTFLQREGFLTVPDQE